MKKKKIFFKTAKKTIAFMLAVSTFVLNGYGLDFYKQTANVVKAEAASTDVLSGKDRNVIFANSRTDFRDESIYFAMVTRYYNGDESNDVQCWDGTQNNLNDPAWRGDFKGLIEKLDYFKALGFTAIWITPVVENCSGYDYHGYHAFNFSKVDPRYESDDCTYQDLIDAVHARGMKIIQDVVFNHTGNFGEANLIPMFNKEGDLSSPDCLQVIEGSGLPSNYNSLTPAAQYAARLALMKNTDGVNHDVNNLYHHYGNFNWDDYTCQIAQIAGDCVDLNTENPIVYNYLVDAYSKYIDMGVDGFRVDTVRHISRLTFNKVFNDAFMKAGKRNGKDFYMFGEVCTRDNGNYWYRQSPSMSTPYYTWKESKDYEWSDTDLDVNYNSAIQATKDNADNNAYSTKVIDNGSKQYINHTYADLLSDINAFGSSLYKLGLSGKRVAIVGHNCYEWAVSLFAMVLGGIVSVPLDKGLQLGELEDSLIRSEVEAVVFDSKTAELMNTIRESSKTKIKHFICFSDEPDFLSFWDLLNDGKKEVENGFLNFVNYKVDSYSMSILLFTSGTTAKSKAVMLFLFGFVFFFFVLFFFVFFFETDTNMV